MKKILYLSAATVMLFATGLVYPSDAVTGRVEAFSADTVPSRLDKEGCGDKLVDKRGYTLTKRSKGIIMIPIQHPNCL